MFVVGQGRIGGTLVRHSPTPCGVHTRADSWATATIPPGPIVVTTRNDDLDGVIDALPDERRGDLVLIQNGMLRPWLASRGLSEVTRGLLFFAVSSRGATPEVGGPSPFTGPHAGEMARCCLSMRLK